MIRPVCARAPLPPIGWNQYCLALCQWAWKVGCGLKVNDDFILMG